MPSRSITSISGKIKAPAAIITDCHRRAFAVNMLQSQRFPMNNRPHKKEKAKKRSKEYFVKTAVQVIHYTDNTVHSEASKTESNLTDLCHYTKRIGVCQADVAAYVLLLMLQLILLKDGIVSL